LTTLAGKVDSHQRPRATLGNNVRMTTQLRLPYFAAQFPGLFALRKTWQQFDHTEGCKPLDHPQARISMDRRPPFLPGEKALLAKQAAEQRKADAEEAKRIKAARKAEPKQPRSQIAKVEKVALKPASDQPKSKPQEVECRTPPPPFDMLDLPGAMNNMHFFVGSKLARRWFNGRNHAIPKDELYVYPDDMVDTETVSLEFILKHSKARGKYHKLINSEIYDEEATKAIKAKMGKWLAAKFVDKGIAYSGDLDILKLCRGDIQQLHNDFLFRRVEVSNFDTLTWDFGLTDLTASLAHFSFIAAIANARIYSAKYFSYPKGAAPVHCCEPTIEVTHIYVYARDSYSFADRPGKKASQYLGHWNRSGVVLVADAAAADLSNKFTKSDIQWGDIPYDGDGFDKPVDLLRGMFVKPMRKPDVFYPVRNTDYQKWREKFNRGGDFLICTKPRKIKLPKPIKLTMDEICKPYEK
jgi:hypothetical protein